MQRVSFWQAHLASLERKEEESPANVLIKYLVPPPVQEEFVEVFKGVKDGELRCLVLHVVSGIGAAFKLFVYVPAATSDEEGNKDYYLLKPITDNIR